MLEWQLRALTGVGVERVVIVVGYEADRVRDHARDLALPAELSFVHNVQYRVTNVLTSWRMGSRELTGDHFYTHGDTIFERELLHRLLSVECNGVTLSVDRHPCADEEMKVTVRNAHIIGITKAMDPSRAHGEFTGVLRVAKGILPMLQSLADEVLSGPEGPAAFFEAALQRGLDKGSLPVRWVDVTGLRWREVDFPEDLEAAEALMSTMA
jgi:L-glutamine-phosphate cytidylyltransferase